MHTSNPVAIPAAAPRGVVQKTFVPATILSGFTDPAHFGQLAEEYLASTSAQEKAKILGDADATRQFVAQLPPLTAVQVELRDIELRRDKTARQVNPLNSESFREQVVEAEDSKILATLRILWRAIPAFAG